MEDPEIGRCLRAWGQVSDWRQMAAILTIYNIPSSTLLQDRSSQQTMSVCETAEVWGGDTTCPKPGSWWQSWDPICSTNVTLTHVRPWAGIQPHDTELKPAHEQERLQMSRVNSSSSKIQLVVDGWTTLPCSQFPFSANTWNQGPQRSPLIPGRQGRHFHEDTFIWESV